MSYAFGPLWEEQKAKFTSLLRPLYALLTASKYLLEVECHPLYYGALERTDFRFYLQINIIETLKSDTVLRCNPSGGL